MATIQLTEPYFYKAGKGGVSRVVGVESGAARVVRYGFTAPDTGASEVQLTLSGMALKAGQAIGLRFFITTDPESYANPGTDAPYLGSLTFQSGYTQAAASAKTLLLPGQTYYLWIFPAVRVYGWYGWALEEATLRTQGGSCSIPEARGGILGEEIPISLQVFAPFTHRLTWQFGESSGVIGENVEAACTWVPPVTLASQIPNSTSGIATITCQTLDGENLIGSRSVYIALSVPETAVPTVTAAWEDTAEAPAALGRLVQNVSKIAVEAQAAGSYGSTVVSTALTLNGKPYAGQLIADSGDIPLVLTVTDSRGRTAAWQETLTVHAYQVPAVKLTAHRCDAEGNPDEAGEYALVTAQGSVSPIAGNSALLYLTYGTGASRITLSAGEFTRSRIVAAPSVSTMKLSARVTDEFAAASDEMTLSVGFATVDFLDGGKGIAFGTSATKEGFTCSMDQDMCGHRLYNLGVPQSDTDAAPLSLALPWRGVLTDRDGAVQGLYRYGTGLLLHIGDAENALQLFFDGTALTARARLEGLWNGSN